MTGPEVKSLVTGVVKSLPATLTPVTGATGLLSAPIVSFSPTGLPPLTTLPVAVTLATFVTVSASERARGTSSTTRISRIPLAESLSISVTVIAMLSSTASLPDIL